MGLTWLVGTPVTVVLAWWLWFRDRSSRELQKWRETLLLFGLIATSLNVALFAGWAVWLLSLQPWGLEGPECLREYSDLSVHCSVSCLTPRQRALTHFARC